jgi:hypothetical protein
MSGLAKSSNTIEIALVVRANNLDGHHGRTPTEKSLPISVRCLRACVVRDAGAITRDQIVTQMSAIDSPHHGLIVYSDGLGSNW